MMPRLAIYGLAALITSSTLLGISYGLIQHGRTLEAVDNNARAALVAEQVQIRQATDQKAINNLADLYYQSMARENDRAQAIRRLKDELRKASASAAGENSHNRSVLPAAYQLFNRAANSADLPDPGRAQRPDDAGDGLDAIQYAASEAIRVKLKVNALQAIVRQSDCFQ